MVKTKTFKSKKNLNLIKSLPCFICGAGPSDPDHFKTRGAGGSDELSNLNALCRKHHIEKGAIGVKTFWQKYYIKINSMREKYDLPPLEIKWHLD